MPDFTARFADFDADAFQAADRKLQAEFPNLKIIATTLRDVKSASLHDLSAACFAGGEIFKAVDYENAQVFDRVGGGDAFASGFIYGLLEEKGASYALECGTACAVLTMTTPGGNASALLS